MAISFLREVFAENDANEFLIWHNQSYKYAWLTAHIDSWKSQLTSVGILNGSIVAIEGDFSPNSIAILLALIDLKCIVLPLTEVFFVKKPLYYQLASVKHIIKIFKDDSVTFHTTNGGYTHDMLKYLIENRRSGLILFTSGSTGASKGVVHDFQHLLDKYTRKRHNLKTIVFMSFDHIGGIDTLFYNLSNASTMVVLEDRSPLSVCQTIEQHRVEVLPVSPTFIRLLLLSKAFLNYDLSSLKIVTCGAEVMSESTALEFLKHFPKVKLLQKYGTSEIGNPSCKSKENDSSWVKLGGDGFNFRIVDGLLEIKSDSAMLGYLNAPNPFTDDGWFQTGDAVVQDGDFFKILGRTSDMINVGGEKVYPAEVEDVILQLSGVEDVAVRGVTNPITGQMVVATVVLTTDEALADFRKRMRSFCAERLPAHKIPQKIELTKQAVYSERFKKIRRSTEC